MKILKLKLKDFGRHKNLELDFSGNVVGMFGANGSGKSTIQKAIEFAVTGSIAESGSDAMCTYIRDYGMEGSPSSAIVEAEFEANGTLGKITRKITYTAGSRKLEWDGNTYTKVADVDNIMNDIIGADKRAIGALVCVKQGELDKLLNGTDSERRDLLMRLCMLSHLERASKVAAGYRKSMQSTCIDYGPMRDAAQERLEDAEELVHEKKQVVALFPDVTVELQQASTLYNAANNIATATLALQRAQNGYDTVVIASQNVTEDTLVQKEKQADDVNAQLMALMEENTKIADAKTKLQSYYSYKNSVTALSECELMIEDNGWDVVGRINDMEERAIKAAQLIATNSTNKANAQALATAEEELRAANEAYEIEHESLQKVIKDNASAIEEYGEKLNRINRDKSLATQVIQLHKASSELACGKAECPLCGSPLDDPGAIEELRKEAEATLQRLDLEAMAFNATIADLQSKAQEAENRLATLSAAVDSCKRKVEACKAQPTDYVPDDELPNASELQQRLNKAKLAIAERDRLTSEVASLSMHNIENPIELEMLEVLSRKDNTEPITKLKDQLRELNAEIDDIKVKLTSVVKAESVLKNANETLATREEEMSAVWDSIAEVDTPFVDKVSAELDKGKAITATFVEGVLQDLRSANDSYIKAQQDMQNAQRTLEDAKKAVEDVEKKIEDQHVRLQIIDELETFESVFKPSGVATNYLDYKFRQVAEVTQDFLAALGANFIVTVSEEKPFAFDFVRTDDSSGTIMYQSKLSGGQKVRLAIAFLLAIHSSVIPDVGLLLLDEPSMHLDDEGVSQLLDMLTTLGQVTGGTQVIVCDHNPALVPAFDKIVQL